MKWEMVKYMGTRFDFDEPIQRKNTGSRKWDSLVSVFGKEDVLPLWIADMDFAAPPEVVAALQERVKHPVYGYNIQEDRVFDAIIAWNKRRHGIEIEKDWLVLTPGVVPAFTFGIYALTQPGDGVIIQPPVYPPFFAAIRDNERTVVENSLIERNGYYEIDFVDLEAKLAEPQNKVLLFCSPHNPVGRVWKKEELQRIQNLCRQYEVDVLCDEIHNDLIYSEHEHTVLAYLQEDVWKQTITFMAASKTFNIAGLNFSYAIIPCSRRRKKFVSWLSRMHLNRNNLFGVLATQAAYENGEEWLEELLRYVEENANVLSRFVQERLPQVQTVKPEGTYLAWLDFRKVFSSGDELRNFLINQAQIGLNDGSSFGLQGEGFARINLATQRSLLLEALQRIEKSLSHK